MLHFETTFGKEYKTTKFCFYYFSEFYKSHKLINYYPLCRGNLYCDKSKTEIYNFEHNRQLEYFAENLLKFIYHLSYTSDFTILDKYRKTDKEFIQHLFKQDLITFYKTPEEGSYIDILFNGNFIDNYLDNCTFNYECDKQYLLKHISNMRKDHTRNRNFFENKIKFEKELLYSK